jgi:hypothetical protein
MQGKLDNLRPQLAEAARIGDETHLREYMYFIIEAIAVLRFLLGQQRQGARLFSAAAMELKRKGSQLNQPDENFTGHWTKKIRETLGEEIFSEVMAEGGKLSYEEAVKESREWLEEG